MSKTGRNTVEKIASAYTRYEEERKIVEERLNAENRALRDQARISHAEAVVERQKKMNFIFIAGGVALLLLALFFFYRYRIKRRSEQKLEEKVLLRTHQLTQANEELSKFIYQSSHDMRSPLTSIQGLLGIALQEKDPAQIHAFLEKALGRVQHLDGVYTGLIDFMSVKERIPKPEPVSLCDLSQECIEWVKEKRNPPAFDFRNLVPGTSRMNADAFLLRIILRNLILNAVDFRDESRAGVCSITFDENARTLCVADNGKGIAADVLPGIFGMFTRGSHQSKGSGLGLYTSQMAASKIAATLQVNSQPGEGSVFCLGF